MLSISGKNDERLEGDYTFLNSGQGNRSEEDVALYSQSGVTAIIEHSHFLTDGQFFSVSDASIDVWNIRSLERANNSDRGMKKWQ